MSVFAVIGELRFELVHLSPERVCARAEQARKRLRQFVFDGGVLLVERDEAHGILPPPRGCCVQNLPLQRFQYDPSSAT